MSTDLSTDLPAGQQQGTSTTRSPAAGVAEDAPTDAAVGRGTLADLEQHGDRRLEAILQAHDLTSTIMWVDVEAIDWDATADRQIRSETVDPDTVDRYVAAIEAGAIFPAGLASSTDDGMVWIVAGVHRARAYEAAGWERFPTYWSPHADERTLWLVREAAILAVEDFEGLHRPDRPAKPRYPWGRSDDPAPRRAASASPVHALRDRCRDVLDVDAGEAIDSCPPGDALITADLLRRTAARLATTADRIVQKAGQR